MELPAPSFDGNVLFALPAHLARGASLERDRKQSSARLLGQRRELPQPNAPKTGVSVLTLRSGR